MCARELAFIDLTQRQLASGGDIDDALVRVTIDGDGAVRIEYAPGHGETRLYYAARRGWCSAITWLLEQGADVHVSSLGGGWTPLHGAAAWDQRDAAVLLLDAGARVDQCGRYGQTALHDAATRGLTAMCKLLLSHGASLDARAGGDDPEACARLSGRTTAADFLAAVRAAGGWRPYVDAPRKELLALRRELLTAAADFLAAVRAAGGWRGYVDAPRKELLALRLRRDLLTLLRTGPCRARAQARLFIDARVPDDVFAHVLAFWRGARDL